MFSGRQTANFELHCCSAHCISVLAYGIARDCSVVRAVLQMPWARFTVTPDSRCDTAIVCVGHLKISAFGNVKWQIAFGRRTMVVINQSWTEQMSMLLSGHILRAVKLPKVYPFPFSAFVPFGHHPFPNVGSPLVGGGKSPYAVLPLSSFLFPFFYISFCPFPPLCLAAATRCRGVLSSRVGGGRAPPADTFWCIV